MIHKEYAEKIGSKKLKKSDKKVDVTIVGAQKCGTTSLLRYLSQHPTIVGHQQPEFSYLATESMYELPRNKALNKFFGRKNVESERILLAKAVAVMYDGVCMSRLYHHNPQCHIIVLLRDPVPRAYSAFWNARKCGVEKLDSFWKALMREEDRVQQSIKMARHCGYVDHGRYVEQVKMLYDVFGPDNVQVFSLTDLKNHPTRLCNAIYNSLGIKNYNISTHKKHNTRRDCRSPMIENFIRFCRDNRLTNKLRRSSALDYPITNMGHFLGWLQNINRLDVDKKSPSDRCRQYIAEELADSTSELAELVDIDISGWSTCNSE